MENKTVVYILRSETDPLRHYTGLTSNVEQRLKWHNAGQNAHTVRDRPWGLLAAFHFPNEKVARRFEKYLKSGSGREFARRHFGDLHIPETCLTLSAETGSQIGSSRHVSSSQWEPSCPGIQCDNHLMSRDTEAKGEQPVQPADLQKSADPVVRDYVSQLRLRTEAYALPLTEARAAVDAALGSASLTNALYRMRRDEDLV